MSVMTEKASDSFMRKLTAYARERFNATLDGEQTVQSPKIILEKEPRDNKVDGFNYQVYVSFLRPNGCRKIFQLGWSTDNDPVEIETEGTWLINVQSISKEENKRVDDYEKKHGRDQRILDAMDLEEGGDIMLILPNNVNQNTAMEIFKSYLLLGANE